jgi:hypothetical protein
LPAIDYLSLAHETGRQLVAAAQWSGDECTWLTFDMERGRRDGGKPPEVAAGGDLYAGVSGVGLFLIELWAVTADRDVLRTALGAAERAWASFSRRSQAPTDAPVALGFYSGSLGVAYFLARVAQLRQSEQHRDRALAVLGTVPGTEARDDGLDVIAGSAGAIAPMLRISKALGWTDGVECARAMGEQILRHAHRGVSGWWWSPGYEWQVRGLTGYGHGAAGFGYGLLELYTATRDPKYRFAAEQAYAYETAMFKATEGNWPDFRNIDLMFLLTAEGGTESVGRSARAGVAFPEWKGLCMTAWCHGAPGIGLTRLRAYQLLNEERYAKDARVAVDATATALADSLQNSSLCHGGFGNAETLRMSEAVFGVKKWNDLIERMVLGQVDKRKRRGHWPSGDRGEVRQPGLLVGEAGSGYFMLRMHSQSVPSILFMTASDEAFEIPNDEADLADLRRADVDSHFRQTLRVFDRLLPELEPMHHIASRGPTEACARRVYDEARRRADDTRDSALRRMLQDAFGLERARFDAEVEYNDFTSEVWRGVRRPEASQVVWASDVFVNASSVSIVDSAFDWGSWLQSNEARPKEIDEGQVYLVYRTRLGIAFRAANPFTATVVDILREPATAQRVTDALLERVGATEPSEAAAWRGKVQELLLALLAAGIVDVDRIGTGQ